MFENQEIFSKKWKGKRACETPQINPQTRTIHVAIFKPGIAEN